jgi:GntR family transcriptional repressor for pyruvate dehydrogenase complex
MEFTPLKKQQRIYQYIIKEIKQSIAERKILPGERLPSERSLASMFDVSRTSVKEALTVLESSGIVTVRPGVGVFINDMPQHDLLYKLAQILDQKIADFMELLEMRQSIEVDAAFYAANRMATEQHIVFEEIYKNLIAALKKGDFAIEEDFAFHYYIVQSTKNGLMLEVMNLLSKKIRENVKESRDYSATDQSLNKNVMEEHRKIFLAIIEKNPDHARKAMWEHHENIKNRYNRSILKRGKDLESARVSSNRSNSYR